MGEEIFYYDQYNRLGQYVFDGTTYATIAYDAYSRVDYIDYNNAGQMRLTLARDTLGRVNSKTYRMGDGTTTVVDTITRSQNGRVTTDTVSSGSNNLLYEYDYDAAGRLTGAAIGSNTYSYGFGTQNTATCGTGNNKNANSGKNSNRTSQTVNGVTTYFCYDYADRLTNSSNNKYAGAVYDSHGNMTSLGSGATPLLMYYDSSDRNSGFEEINNNTGNGTATYYDRDVQGRVTGRYMCNVVAWDWQCGTNDYYYGFTGSGDGPSFLRNSNDDILEKYISLAGGLLLTIRPAETGNNQKQYGLPGMLGHTLLTTNAAGTNTSNGTGPLSSFAYDPFGNPISGSVLPSNTIDGSYAFGGSRRKLTETTFDLAPIQMGARIYLFFCEDQSNGSLSCITEEQMPRPAPFFSHIWTEYV